MRRFAIVAAIALLLLTGSVFSQTSVWLGTVEGEYAPDTLVAGALVTMYIGFTNVGSGSNYNFSNGFEISSPDGAEWSYPVWFHGWDLGCSGPSPFFDSVGVVDVCGFEPYFTEKFGILWFSGNGVDADTVAFYGGADAPFLGLVQGHDQERFIIPIQTRVEDAGKHICLDSSWFPPSGTWEWGALEPGEPDVIPEWDGPHCWVLHDGCCHGMAGNVDYDGEHIVDIGDLTALISYLYIPPHPAPFCLDEANVDGDGEGIVDIGDLTALIAYLYIPPNPLPSGCE